MSKTLAIVIVAAALCARPVLAQDTISDEIITFWAQHAIPLDEFVKQGYGQSKPSDANSPEWCDQQPITVSLLYADSPVCARLQAKMEALGRIKAKEPTPLRR